MSIKAIAWALESECPSPSAKLVLLTLADAHNGHTGDCFPSLPRIVKLTGLSESGVKLAIRALEAAGMVSRSVEKDDSGRTRGVRYVLKMFQGRGHSVPPRGQSVTPGGGTDEPLEGALTDPPYIEPEKGTGKEPEVTRDKRASHTDFPPNAFEVWYEGYPHKVGRQAAEKSFERVRKSGKVSFARLIEGRDQYVAIKRLDVEWCNPATWLNQGRWDDQPAVIVPFPNAHQPMSAPYDQQPRKSDIARAFDRLDEKLSALVGP